MPSDLINIHSERFIFEWLPLPAADTRPTVILGAFYESGSYWILMDVVGFLYQAIFSRH